ncbi:hypothetical protein M501DRAFT_998675 [Patellaria atrata CBS 101060]|uniref:Transcriptional regulatory protein RXT2 N-terminal domain-containing protein n=1 Tax=Patellaria atrata CBS 101060 TaxID=1346257 RepID=A0A9P4SIF9_9PEZI|nr:hypothetical protein M501DRAFT_998675 [Patellaria atrata CBS 101060]
MAATQALIAETITAMKRAVQRADESSESDDQIYYPTNRANKLKRKARYVQQGRLDNGAGPKSYKRKIGHANYERYIIHRNPPRYDVDGEIVDLDDNDIDSDALSEQDENPWAGIKIENTLAPLTSLTQLATHPSWSAPYQSRALKTMIEECRENLYREQNALWRAKELLTKFRGDETWAPVGIFATEYDELLLRNTIPARATASSATQSIQNGEQQLLEWDPSRSGADGLRTPPHNLNRANRDVDGLVMEDVQNSQLSAGTSPQITSNGVPVSSEGMKIENPTTNGESHNGMTDSIGVHSHNLDAPPRDNLPSPPEEDDTSSQANSHRMTTRRRARGPSNPASTTSSPAPTSETVPSVHPFFAFPTHLLTDRSLGLQPHIADQMRQILLLYVQKQDEVVRGAKELLDGLLAADRKRKEVLKWSKAEAHVGTMKDGEDWYDKEEWGLTEDLVKGKEEEEEVEVPGKKTRQRRRAGD